MSRRTTTTHTSAFHNSERDLLKSASAPAAGRHRTAATTPAHTPTLKPGPAPARRLRAARKAQPKT